MPTINGRTFYEFSDQPRARMSWGLDSARVVRPLFTRGYCDEDGRVLDAAALLGYATVQREVVAGTTRVWIARTLPDAWPVTVSSPVGATTNFLWASSVPTSEALVGRAGAPGLGGSPASADGWKYTVEYRAESYNLKEDTDDNVLPNNTILPTDGPLATDTPTGAEARPDEGIALREGWATYSRYVTKLIEPGAKALTLPNGFVKFVLVAPETAAQALPIGLPMPFFRSVVTYIHHLIPVEAYPAQAVARCANCVNDSSFDGHTAETLLFSSARLTPLQGPFGNRLLNVEYRFIYQPFPDFDGTDYTTRGWNYFPGVLSGKLRARQITSDQAGGAPANNTTRIFKTADFSSLFRPDQV